MKPEPGTYALVLSSSTEALIRVGRLGRLRLQPGFYIYLGSALGPGGLRARVRRHQKVGPRSHWHIDYLRAHTRLDQIWYCYDPSRREHQWASLMGAAPGASIPLAGFGSSDCGCASHLYFFNSRPSRRSFQRRLRAADAEHPPVRCTAHGAARRVTRSTPTSASTIM